MNGTQIPGKKCKNCETVCSPNRGTNRGFQRMSRGLCGNCYSRLHSRNDGSLDRIADPARGKRVRSEGETANTLEGYVSIMRDGHVIPEHRDVMQRHLGRPLVSGENVHHINGDRADNSLTNLELWFTPQPYGQRVEELIAYMIGTHSERLIEALGVTGRTAIHTTAAEAAETSTN